MVHTGSGFVFFVLRCQFTTLRSGNCEPNVKHHKKIVTDRGVRKKSQVHINEEKIGSTKQTASCVNWKYY